MKKGLTEIVCILDRSGSMSGLEKDTIGGFNSLIKKQRKESGEAVVSTVLFDDTCDVIHDRVPMEKVAKLTEDTYFVRGCTALLDAVGGAIHHIGNIHKYARDEDKPEKTLFIITTDGMENGSNRYTYKKVKKMVERQKEKYGWEFLFLGANIDAIAAAGNIGIHADRAVTYQCDEEGTALNYEVLGEAIHHVRSSDKMLAPSWKQKIDEDVKRRGRRN
ncbi:vWA domain-containing protein [Selenomonas montiformis]|uniref:vWA domain-containing protein n=1 Tax=Selenomonas montiformis TaxID=2652285 RepID=UPI003F8AA64F